MVAGREWPAENGTSPGHRRLEAGKKINVHLSYLLNLLLCSSAFRRSTQQPAFTGNGGNPCRNDWRNGVPSIMDPSKRRRGGKCRSFDHSGKQAGLAWAQRRSHPGVRVARFHLCSKELRSLTCNYYSQSIHIGVATFEYTPAPYRDFSESYHPTDMAFCITFGTHG